ncbi:ubiquitin-activating E1 FCCH domain-containing protein [Andreprevotia chitinilytica]|uniref:ubiquitin-activating E1 FCCH domain-containing protein n=1 Tax=Andreprevotia chitinilytica TaxID=396808 RepID=UPI000558AAE1|nr:phage tail tube protein [Andreprevotia chitinilytica]
MPSKAVSAQGAKIKVSTGSGGPKPITGIGKGNPCVITSNGHGFKPGNVVALAAIVGMVELNGKTPAVQYVTANTYSLAGVNSSGFGDYTNGGTATPVAFSEVGEVTDFDGFDGQASEEDVSTLASEAVEKRLGLVDYGGLSISLKFVKSDVGQAALRAAQATREVLDFMIELSNGDVASFSALVKQFSIGGAVNKVLTGKVQLTISGPVTWA